jgi:hypothetical protein
VGFGFIQRLGNGSRETYYLRGVGFVAGIECENREGAQAQYAENLFHTTLFFQSDIDLPLTFTSGKIHTRSGEFFF